jgi:hypothetical protein
MVEEQVAQKIAEFEKARQLQHLAVPSAFASGLPGGSLTPSIQRSRGMDADLKARMEALERK